MTRQTYAGLQGQPFLRWLVLTKERRTQEGREARRVPPGLSWWGLGFPALRA